METIDRPTARATTRRGHGPLVVVAALAVLVAAAGACSKDSSTSTAGSGTTQGTTQGTTGTTASAEKKNTAQMSSDEVKELQKSLNAVGCDAGPVDGVDGGETRAGLEAFQAASGLTVDGLYGPQTASALGADVAAGKRVCTTPSSQPGSTTTTAKATTTTNASTTSTTNPCLNPSTRGNTPLCSQLTITPDSGPAGQVVTVVAPAAGCGLYGPQIVIWNQSTTVATGTLGAADAKGNMTGTVTVPAGTPPGSGLLIGMVAASVDCMRSFTVS